MDCSTYCWFVPSYVSCLLERGNLLRQLGYVGTLNHGHLGPILEELEGGHGLDAFRSRNLLGVVDVDLNKDDIGIVLGHLFKVGGDESAGPAPVRENWNSWKGKWNRIASNGI